MQTESVNTSAHDRELNQILAAYLEAAEVGSAPDPAEYQRRHPAFAAELAEFFALRQEVEGVAAPLRAALAGATVASLKALQELVLQLGDFRIVREIGRGGMGIVYEAQQLSLGRRVALKVLPFAGALDARQLQRFKTEAQAAAQLHHTHIVPVHFVGCERGVHFYAMQYIEGQSLAAVIHELRHQRRPGERGRVSAPSNEPGRVSTPSQETAEFAQGTTDPSGEGAPAAVSLSPCLRVSESAFFQTAARLAIQAAEALEHAHEMGVVHRDIKPANLLLDERGQLWVTDFGLARLQSDAGLTVTGDLLGTLRYMSPEQALGQRAAVDHRTDIYSLGVTLYELLTLEPAFAGADRHEVLQKIAFAEPRLPRRVNAAIPRELETIVLKAIAKEPHDRYATVQALADDLRRFLDHRPILARRPTLWQRARKWLQRNPGLAWAAMAGLLLGSIVSVWKYVDERAARSDADLHHALAERKTGEALNAKQHAERQRLLAQQHAEEAVANLTKALAAADQLLRRVAQESLLKVPQMEPVRKALLEDALQFYQSLLLNHETDATIRDETGRAYRNVGHLYDELGQTTQAEQAYRRALALLEPLVAEFPSEEKYRRRLAGIHVALADALLHLRQFVEAERACRRALELWHSLASEFPANLLYMEQDFNARHELAGCVAHNGRKQEAEEMHRQLLADLDRLPGSRERWPLLWAQTHQALAGLAQQPREKERLYRQALQIHEKVLAQSPDNPAFRVFRAASQYWLGIHLQQIGRPQEAETLLRESVTHRAQLVADFPHTVQYRKNLAESSLDLVRLLTADRRFEEAEQVYRQSLPHVEQLVATNPDRSWYVTLLLNHLQEYRWLKLASGRKDEAAKACVQELAIIDKLGAEMRISADQQATRYADIAKAFARIGRAQQAKNVAQRIIQLLEVDGKKDRSWVTDGLLAQLGLELLKAQRYGEAEPLLRECLTIRAEKLSDNWLRFNAMSMLGEALGGQQKYAEAEPLLVQGHEGLKQREQQIPAQVQKLRPLEAAERLVRLYEAMNQPEKAAAWREKAKPKPPEAATGSVQAPWRP